LSYALTLGLQGGWNGILNTWLSTGLLITFGYSFIYSVLKGISSQDLDNHHRYKPNEGIRRSLYHGLLSFTIGTFVSVVGYILSNALHFAVSDGLQSGQKGLTWSLDAFRTGFLQGLHVDFHNVIVLGLLGGLLAGLLLGGLAGLQHYVLRLVLRITKPLPLNLSRFLDAAADCILLHRVGGGYIFIHRLLQDYFASSDKGEG
jgi:hypothetical protein